MSRLEKFLGKPQKKKIGDEELDIYPLTFEDTPIVVKLGDTNPDVRSQGMKELITKVVKKSIPEATDEDIKNLDLRYLNVFLSAVFDVSGLEVDKKKLEEMTANLTS